MAGEALIGGRVGRGEVGQKKKNRCRRGPGGQLCATMSPGTRVREESRVLAVLAPFHSSSLLARYQECSFKVHAQAKEWCPLLTGKESLPLIFLNKSWKVCQMRCQKARLIIPCSTTEHKHDMLPWVIILEHGSQDVSSSDFPWQPSGRE